MTAKKPAAPRKAAPAKASTAKAPIAKDRPAESTRSRVERVLVWVHDANEACRHACKTPLEEVATGTKLPLPLVVKISKHLEHLGLLEYDKGTVELTVQGMLEAEKVQAPPPGAKIV